MFCTSLVATSIFLPVVVAGDGSGGSSDGGGWAGGGDGFLNNSFSYVYIETSAPPPIITTPVPPDMNYAEADCSGGVALSTNAQSCSALLPDGQGVQIPPGALFVSQEDQGPSVDLPCAAKLVLPDGIFMLWTWQACGL